MEKQENIIATYQQIIQETEQQLQKRGNAFAISAF